jgi:hypothetical protein
MFIRIVTGIRDHFESRVTEWIMGASITWYGLRLVGPENAWSNPEAWAGMTRIMSEDAWGWVCIGLGLIRLVALVINGTFANTAYSRFSPHVRGVSAVLGAGFWFMVFLSVSVASTSGSGIYQLPLVLDCWCVYHAFRDTGRARAARDGRT